MKVGAVALLVLVLLVSCAQASTVPFPRVWNYTSQSGSGSPLVPGSLYSERNELAIRNYSRFGIITPTISPWGSLRGTRREDVISRMRVYGGANTTILTYINCQGWFHVPSFNYASTDSTWYADLHRTFQWSEASPTSGPSGWLHKRSPHAQDSIHVYHNINWGNAAWRDSVTRMVLRIAAMTDTSGHRLFDGIFLDSWERAIAGYLTDNCPEAGYSCECITDFARQGYGSAVLQDTALTQGMTAFINAIHTAVPNWKVYLNTGNFTDAYVQPGVWRPDGLIQEGFFSGATGFNGALTSFTTAHDFITRATPDVKLLKGEMDATAIATPRGAVACKAARYILGTACMGDGWAFYQNNNIANGPHPYYDEYSVTKPGAADTLGANQGWLGQPLGAAVVTADFVYRRDFEHGTVFLDTAGTDKTVNLAASTLKRIAGVVDVATNTGAVVGASFLLTARDALFLMKNDVLRPGPIADLTITSTGARTVSLQFTASGDDSVTGNAVSFDVRYSTGGAINDANWASATPAGTYSVCATGLKQNVTVVGLNVSTAYNFAVRVNDYFAFPSATSNSPSTTTLKKAGWGKGGSRP
jgi:hypothetical protein